MNAGQNNFIRQFAFTSNRDEKKNNRLTEKNKVKMFIITCEHVKACTL